MACLQIWRFLAGRFIVELHVVATSYVKFLSMVATRYCISTYYWYTGCWIGIAIHIEFVEIWWMWQFWYGWVTFVGFVASVLLYYYPIGWQSSFKHGVPSCCTISVQCSVPRQLLSGLNVGVLFCRTWVFRLPRFGSRARDNDLDSTCCCFVSYLISWLTGSNLWENVVMIHFPYNIVDIEARWCARIWGGC